MAFLLNEVVIIIGSGLNVRKLVVELPSAVVQVFPSSLLCSHEQVMLPDPDAFVSLPAVFGFKGVQPGPGLSTPFVITPGLTKLAVMATTFEYAAGHVQLLTTAL